MGSLPCAPPYRVPTAHCSLHRDTTSVRSSAADVSNARQLPSSHGPCGSCTDTTTLTFSLSYHGHTTKCGWRASRPVRLAHLHKVLARPRCAPHRQPDSAATSVASTVAHGRHRIQCHCHCLARLNCVIVVAVRKLGIGSQDRVARIPECASTGDAPGTRARYTAPGHRSHSRQANVMCARIF